MRESFVTTSVAALCALVLSCGTASAQTLPGGWSTSDIGSVGAAGTASGASGAFTVKGAGADVWGTADAFRFVYLPMTGDGSIVSQVTSVENVNAWTKAGVMMRESLSAGSRHAFMLVSAARGGGFQRRTTTGGSSAYTDGGSAVAAPQYVKLTRRGSTITAYRSTDGSSWITVGSVAMTMPATIYAGVAVSSHQAGILATAGFASTALATSVAEIAPPATGLPSGWSSGDIGAVGIGGAAVGAAGTFSVDGAGADIWGSADAFRFAYVPLTGDGAIVSQVTAVQNVNAWTKAGVMMRETLSAGSRHAFMLVSAGKGAVFQRRTATGGSSSSTAAGTTIAAPHYVKLTRAGSTITAYRSTDGATWTMVGSDTIPMASTIYVGVAVTSHVAGVLATASFASTVVMQSAAALPAPPPPSSSATLRVLHWNVHHGGVGTDGRLDPARIATWIATMKPDVASLNEVDTQAQLDAIVNSLTSKTGAAWYKSFSGRGNAVISRFRLDATSRCLYGPSYNGYAAQGSFLVNGRTINLWASHLHVDSATARLAETKAMQACALEWNEARILAGDYNMQYGSTEYKQSVLGYADAWLAAKALGTAVNYSGNCDGCTRNSRIDYVFTSGGASFLKLKGAQIYDTRDSRGVMPSDHKPLVVTYTVD